MMVNEEATTNKAMYSEKFKELKQKYLTERKMEMEDDQFAALIYTFPSILVAYADGKVDKHEKNFIREIPEVLTDGYLQDGSQQITSTLTDDYFKEMNFLINNLEKWHQPFITALKDQLDNSQNERNAIFKIMWQTADSSADISEAERKCIDNISNSLGL